MAESHLKIEPGGDGAAPQGLKLEVLEVVAIFRVIRPLELDLPCQTIDVAAVPASTFELKGIFVSTQILEMVCLEEEELLATVVVEELVTRSTHLRGVEAVGRER